MTRQTLSTAPAVAGAPSIVAPEPAGAPIGFVEFVALVAALMSLAALGIDSMLPALPAMGRSLGVATENQRQFIITAFILGFGIAQLAHGPLADRYGRRAVLLWAIGGYVVANIACAVSASFTLCSRRGCSVVRWWRRRGWRRWRSCAIAITAGRWRG